MAGGKGGCPSTRTPVGRVIQRRGFARNDLGGVGMRDFTDGALGVYVLASATSAQSAGCNWPDRRGKEQPGQHGDVSGDWIVYSWEFLRGLAGEKARISDHDWDHVRGVFLLYVRRVSCSARSHKSVALVATDRLLARSVCVIHHVFAAAISDVTANDRSGALLQYWTSLLGVWDGILRSVFKDGRAWSSVVRPTEGIVVCGVFVFAGGGDVFVFAEGERLKPRMDTNEH